MGSSFERGNRKPAKVLSKAGAMLFPHSGQMPKKTPAIFLNCSEHETNICDSTIGLRSQSVNCLVVGSFEIRKR